MNVLALVQEFLQKRNFPVAPSFMSSVNADVTLTQIYGLLQETLRELSEYTWNEQKIQDSFTTVAANDQGALTSILGADFNSLIFATMWDTTLRRPVFGPVSDAMWANLQAFPASGPIYQFKVFGNNLHIFPAPPAGDTVYLIYQSSYPVASSAGTPKATITADTDLFIVPEAVVSRGLDWRWKKEKGEAWESDYIIYNDLLGKKLQKTGMPNIHLDNARFKLTPGIWVPAGDWPH